MLPFVDGQIPKAADFNNLLTATQANVLATADNLSKTALDRASTADNAAAALASKNAVTPLAAQVVIDAAAVQAARTDIQTNWGDKLATAAAQADIATTQAGIATAGSNTAIAQAALAVTAKTQAEIFAAAAKTDANIKDTTAIGITDTTATANKYFWTPVVSSNDLLILWKNVSGTAVEQGRYPSAALVEAIAQRTPINPGALTAIVFSDANDESLGYIDTTGGLNLLGMPETVQSAAGRIPSVSGTGGASLIGATADGDVLFHAAEDGGFYVARLPDSVQTTLAAALSRAKLALAAHFVGDAAAKEKMRISTNAADLTMPLSGHAIISANGVNGTTTQRIPAVIATATHGLLCMWSQGYAPYNGDGEGAKLVRQNVAINLSTGAVTPGTTTLFKAPDQPQYVVKHPMLGKTASGRIVLCFDTNNVSGVIGGYYIYACYSDDDGQTFSAPVQILAPSGDLTSVCSGSTGRIETMPSGRLILPIYGISTSGNYVSVMYSDNSGVTWAMGGRYTRSDSLHEPAVSLDSQGQLVFSVRVTNAEAKKLILRSPDAGATIALAGLNADLPGTPCAASMCYESGVVLHSGPSHITTRWRYRLRLSYNDGENFGVGYTPFSDTYYVGYTCITPLGGGAFAVAYEGGEVYGINTRENLGIFIFNLREIYDHGTNS